MEDDDIQQMEADPTKSLLEEKESAMLAFVVKAVKAPGSVETDEIIRLKRNCTHSRADWIAASASGPFLSLRGQRTVSERISFVH